MSTTITVAAEQNNIWYAPESAECGKILDQSVDLFVLGKYYFLCYSEDLAHFQVRKFRSKEIYGQIVIGQYATKLRKKTTKFVNGQIRNTATSKKTYHGIFIRFKKCTLILGKTAGFWEKIPDFFGRCLEASCPDVRKIFSGASLMAL